MIKKVFKILLLQVILVALSIGSIKAVGCGEEFEIVDDGNLTNEEISSMCTCEASNNQYAWKSGFSNISTYCCGFYFDDGVCRATDDSSAHTYYSCGDTLGDAVVPAGAECNCEGAKWESYVQWHAFVVDQGICCGWVKEGGFWSVGDTCLATEPNPTAICGETYQSGEKECACTSGGDSLVMPSNDGTVCCGWLRDGKCQSTDVGINDVEVTAETLNNLNPIKIGSGSADLSTPGKIISRALKFFIFPIAGIILFIVLILGGFQMLAGANNSKSLEEGKQRITAAIIGFILLFAAYWIAQLLEIIFGIRILS